MSEIPDSETQAEQTAQPERVEFSDQQSWDTSRKTTQQQPASGWRAKTTPSHQRFRPTAIHKKTFGDDKPKASHYQNQTKPKSNKTLEPGAVWICFVECCYLRALPFAQTFHLPEFTSINRIVKPQALGPDGTGTRRLGELAASVQIEWLDRICRVKFLIRAQT